MMQRSELRRWMIAGVLVASLNPSAGAAPYYTVRDLGVSSYGSQAEYANLFGQKLIAFTGGQPVVQGYWSEDPPPSGLGKVLFMRANHDGTWVVGTAFANNTTTAPWQGFVSYYGPTTWDTLAKGITHNQLALFQAAGPAGSSSPTAAYDVNDSGTSAGAMNNQAALFDPSGRPTVLGSLGGHWAGALGLNDGGGVVGESETTTSGVYHGFVLDGAKLLDLNQLVPANLGLVVVSATDITGEGRIAAWGKDALGQYHVLELDPSAVPVPEPSPLMLAGLLGVLTAVRRTRSRSTRRWNWARTRERPDRPG
jgi:probable HAF family extracellular repeat protein